MDIKRVLVPASIAVLSLGAGAVDLRPGGPFVAGGLAEQSAYSLTAGVVWPWSWRRDFGRTELTGLTEAYVSYWSGRGATRRENFAQVGVVPMLRMRLDGGRSDWFLEGGIGVSVMDRVYRTRSKEFSTTFNFVDVLGAGRSFGPGRRQELGLRVMHVSNADIKQPNPGENFLQLRYAVKF